MKPSPAVLDLTPHVEEIVNKAAELVAGTIARESYLTHKAACRFLDTNKHSLNAFVARHGIPTVFVDSRPRFKWRLLDEAAKKDSRVSK